MGKLFNYCYTISAFVTHVSVFKTRYMWKFIGDCKHYLSQLKFCELTTIVYSEHANVHYSQ